MLKGEVGVQGERWYKEKRGVYKEQGFVYFFFQAEDGIRDGVASRGLGDVYKRQAFDVTVPGDAARANERQALAWLLMVSLCLAAELHVASLHTRRTGRGTHRAA